MTAIDTLKSRWHGDRFDKHQLALVVRGHFHNALNVHEVVEAARVELSADKTLSEIGRRQKLATVAAKEAARFARAQRAHASAVESMGNKRKELAPTVKDKTNLADAALRQEIRTALKGMDRGAIARIVNDPTTDTIVLEAIFEGPTILTGIDAAMRDQLLKAAIERTAGPALIALQEQDEALGLLSAAVRLAGNTLSNAADVRPEGFGKWLDTVAPGDPKEAQAEAAKINREAIAANAAALPLAERMSLVDQLLASNVAEFKAS